MVSGAQYRHSREVATIAMSSLRDWISALRAAISWGLVSFFGGRGAVEARERPAERSCAGDISGIPGCADLFFLRVVAIGCIKGAAES